MLLIGSLIAGILLLLLGRRLFWLFVAAIGFAAGMTFATNVLHIQQELTALIIGLVIGILGALLAIFLQGLAIGVVGFLAGAYILATLAGSFGIDQGIWLWIVYLIGGIVGVFLMAKIFDLAIIILSSLAGASLIVQAFHPSGGISLIVMIVLAIFGIIIQSWRGLSTAH
jgi:uncharacterized protein DUF4203